MKSTDKPNIIWIMAEDMGLDLECYGMQGVSTPNLNRMAAEGIRFDNCFCTNPICSPSRSAMMVGAHQNSFGAHNHRSKRDTPLPEPYRPITYHLRNAGYTCVLGHHGVQGRGRKTDCNFRHDKVGPYDGNTQFGLFDKLDRAEREDVPVYHHIQLQVTHRGDWWESVRHNSPKPVSMEEVALPPYIADTPETRLDWATYLDTVEYMDGEVGMLLEEIRDRNMEENTVVIFIADNGRCQIRGKGYLHETGVHIPLIVWAPGRVDPRTQRQWEKRVISTLDLAASVLDLAGVALPEYVEGMPFIGRDDFPGRPFVYGARDIWDEIDDLSRSVCDGRYNYIRNYKPDVPWDAHQAYLDFYRPTVHAMRRLKREGRLDERTGTFFQDRKPEVELYDWVADPHELRNVADDPAYREVKNIMASRLAAYQQEHPDTGLEDQDSRTPERTIALRVRDWLRDEHPDRFEALTHDPYVKYNALREEYRREHPEE
jgi:arylsulfatase A-like enzyme